MIRLAQGDRLGAVESWNRHFQQRGIRTQAPQLVVEALADPRGRPAALAATDDLPRMSSYSTRASFSATLIALRTS